jgi:probable F420-dependent oxidoreductase
MNLRVGAKVANFGPDAGMLTEMAAACEAAGADSLWLSDRVITVPKPTAAYPFTDDGTVPWTNDTPFIDSVVAMMAVAAATSRAEVGTGVLVLPLRSPLILAKQLASIDMLSGGRVILGVGSGWMTEEFDLLGVPFTERGPRTDEAVAVLRACWQDEPPGVAGRYYQLPSGLGTRPVPARRIPVLAGGMTPAALRRAGRLDGWFGYIRADRLRLPDVTHAMSAVRAARREAVVNANGSASNDTASGEGPSGSATSGSTASAPRGVLRLVGPPDLAARAARDLTDAGITEVVVDLDWKHEGRARQEIERIRDAAVQHPVSPLPGLAEAGIREARQ